MDFSRRPRWLGDRAAIGTFEDDFNGAALHPGLPQQFT
jgi:hypothetical protein